VSKLYYRVLPEAQVAVLAEQGRPAVMMDGVPFRFTGYAPEEITTIIDVSEFMKAKLRGIRCHATQVGHEGPFSWTLDEVMRLPEFRNEYFILARSSVGQPKRPEVDLLAGLG
jgi:LmbE family N-acetylglucosaminyl deacetylase